MTRAVALLFLLPLISTGSGTANADSTETASSGQRPALSDDTDTCTLEGTMPNATADSTEKVSSDQRPALSDDTNTCTLYLAESTIPNAGFGVYTTKPFKKGAPILKADGPSIVITDLGRHQPDGAEPASWLHSNYVWLTYSQEAFEAYSSSSSVLTSFGALPNFHTALKSASPHGEEDYDDSILDRFKDPGAGAISYHMGHQFIAKYRDIDANEEIFVDYGEHWLDSRSEWGFDAVPRAKDFKDGELIIDMLWKTLRRIPVECANDGNGSDSCDANAYAEQDRVENDDPPKKFLEEDANTIIKVAHDIVKMYSERTASLLPRSSSELDNVPRGKENGLALSKLPTRTADWIIEHGQCLDNIVRARSTIHQAGMGGFARRFVAKGSQIVPAPLVHIMDRDTLTMYDYYEENGEKIRNERKVLGTQLLLNYCFGHSNTKMLFCPQTNAILINHCSTRRSWEGQCGKDGPNAALRWAGDWDPSTAEWLNLTLDEISEKDSRGLTLEIYATRDIQPGKEIFLDYGREFEEAWTKHEKDWKPPGWRSNFKSYQSTRELNAKRNETLRTLSDENRNPYPANVLMACIYWEIGEDDWVDDIDEYDADNWKSFDDATILEKFGKPGDLFTGSKESEVFAEFWPCKIFTMNDDNATGVVRIFQSPSNEATSWNEMGIPRFLTNYPLSSVKFFHRPYTSDQHLPGAFRHHIGLSDDLIPAKWKIRG